jgi:hypothetical protein
MFFYYNTNIIFHRISFEIPINPTMDQLPIAQMFQMLKAKIKLKLNKTLQFQKPKSNLFLKHFK